MTANEVKLLLLEDELALGQAIVISLEQMGYQVDWAKNLSEAAAFLKAINPSHHYELMILDRQLPDGDGLDLLGEYSTTSALILSARSAVEDRIEGLRRGADDYLAKPFHQDELQARIESIRRRKRGDLPSGIAPKWAMEESRLEVNSPRGVFSLTPLEFKFLKYLIDRPNSIVSKTRLLREVWGMSILPKTRTVDYVLNQLRKRLEAEPDQPRHLLTVRGAGIRFIPNPGNDDPKE